MHKGSPLTLHNHFIQQYRALDTLLQILIPPGIADAQLLNTINEILPSLFMNIKQIEDIFLGTWLAGH